MFGLLRRKLRFLCRHCPCRSLWFNISPWTILIILVEQYERTSSCSLTVVLMRPFCRYLCMRALPIDAKHTKINQPYYVHGTYRFHLHSQKLTYYYGHAMGECTSTHCSIYTIDLHLLFSADGQWSHILLNFIFLLPNSERVKLLLEWEFIYFVFFASS